MVNPLRWLMSLLFIIQMYLAMAVIAVVFAPFALFNREMAVKACHVFCAWTAICPPGKLVNSVGKLPTA